MGTAARERSSRTHGTGALCTGTAASTERLPSEILNVQPIEILPRNGRTDVAFGSLCAVPDRLKHWLTSARWLEGTKPQNRRPAQDRILQEHRAEKPVLLCPFVPGTGAVAGFRIIRIEHAALAAPAAPTAVAYKRRFLGLPTSQIGQCPGS